LNDPQAFAGAQVQFTPSFVESFATIAVIAAVALVCIEAGGAGLKETAMGGVVMVTFAEADSAASATEVATMVTVSPEGTADGAV
jgi:hypothetical protein